MSRIEIKAASRKKQREIISAVYNKDTAAGLCGKHVSGSTLRGYVDNGIVVITSSYYTETSLNEMFKQFL